MSIEAWITLIVFTALLLGVIWYFARIIAKKAKR